MTRTLNQLVALCLAALLPTIFAAPLMAQNFPGASGNPSVLSRPGGVYYAPGFRWEGRVISGVTVTGSGTIIVAGNNGGGAGGFSLPDGSSLSPDIISNTLSPIIVDWGQGAQETVTPTAMSVGTCPAGNLGVGGSMQCLSITASFVNTHGQSAVVIDGSFGAQTAANLAQRYGGGTVVVDQAWAQMGGTNAILAAMIPFSLVSISDLRTGSPQYWTPTQSVATVLAAPATLVNTTSVGIAVNGAASVAGLYTNANPYFVCVSYVDVMGNEGPCSASMSFTPAAGTTNSIGFTAPAASTGAIGWIPYISLTSGTYNLTYQVPVTSTICTLTKLETTTPACALANTTYNQTGSGAVVSALTVNTAPLHLLATTASTTAAYIGSPSGRTVYAYVPHQNAGAPGITAAQGAYAISPAPGSTVPTVLGTIPIPPGFMNQVGRQIRVCGEATNASGGTATVQNIELLWDSAGSNTAGAPVIVGQMQITATQVTSPENYSFCETLQTTVAGAGVTAGSLMPVFGAFNTSEAAGTLHSVGPDVKAAAVGSLNLAATQGNSTRLHIVWLHTTGTDAAGTTLQGLTVEVI